MKCKLKLSYLLLCIAIIATMITVGGVIAFADTEALGSGEYDGRYGALPENFSVADVWLIFPFEK